MYFWLLVLAAVAIIAALIWSLHRKPPSEGKFSEAPQIIPSSEATPALATHTEALSARVSGDTSNNISHPAQTNLANSPATPPTEQALRARIKELEAELAAKQMQPTNTSTNDLSGVLTGTWTSTNTLFDRSPGLNTFLNTGPRVSRITISSSESGYMVHAWQRDNLWTVDWGEAPLIGVGTGMDPQDPQPRPYGLAIFTGTGMRRGIHYDQRLYLIVRFDSPGIWTRWGEITAPRDHVEDFLEEYMTPPN